MYGASPSAIVAGAIALVLLAQPVRAQQEGTLPKPVPEKAVNWFGKNITILYYDLPAGSMTPRPTIAERYRISQRLKGLDDTTVFAFDCLIARDGKVSDFCAINGESGLSPALALAEVAVRDLPRFPSATKDTPRRVRFTVHYDPKEMPKVDLESGPLFEDSRFLAGLVGAFGYPAAAQRAQVDADVVGECQVQVDLSVICRTLGVRNSGNPALFANALKRLRGNFLAPATLEDGTPAPGTRHRMTVGFRMPK